MSEKKTLVVGVGEVGGALAQVLERKHPVLRHDLEPQEFADPIGVMHICFPYQSRAGFVANAAAFIDRFKPDLTIVNSTIVPGTMRALEVRTGAPLVYSPVRGKHARMVDDLLHYTKFVASSNSQAAQQAEDHFREAGMITSRFSRFEALELAKLTETTYFGVLIAFAQEVNRLAERVGGDYAEIADFFQEIAFLPRTSYFPGFIGGHCVIPNIKLLRELAFSPLFEAVLESNRRRAAELGLPASGEIETNAGPGINNGIESVSDKTGMQGHRASDNR